MDIDGPLRFSVAEGEGGNGYELFIAFREEFQQQPLERQALSFRDYVEGLDRLLSVHEMDDRTRQGVLMTQQIAEQLLPHVESGELVLEEPINIHVRSDSPQVSLVDLLRGRA